MGESTTDNDAVSDKRKDYRSFVGPKSYYYKKLPKLMSILGEAGLTEETYLLDVGCGSLRIGRGLIPFLLPGHYFGLEPEISVLRAGLKKELREPWGKWFIRRKAPKFISNPDFDLTPLGKHKFDIILAHSVFIHCSSDQFALCLKNCRRRLADGGVFIANLWIGNKHEEREKDGKGASYRHTPTKVVIYTEESLADLLSRVGYSIVWREKLDVHHWFRLQTTK